MHKPVEVKAKQNYTIWVRYDDGSQGEVDLSHLVGKGVFSAWGKDVDFNDVYIDKESGGIAWSEDLELCPDSIYYKINQLDPEEQMMKEKS